ncbi:MAG: hypothetical protein BBJ57_05365 [Desulfobacterales bacterium PC51MH44]|nr:MAG: hypothetical protein BBJ57_05365 [Desulfobacterales bacterium PC51MH44]
MFRLFFCLFLIFNLAIKAGANEVSQWPEEFYNPKAVKDDIALPMPCGGSMIFRRIEVPVDGWLGDRKIVIGSGDERFQFKENNRFEYVAGSFTESDNPARRFYLLGKYEVTQMQYNAINHDCKPPNRKDRLPVVGISWFDAVRFAHAYNEWLLKNAPKALPFEDGQTGFIRLPTETEWEYAARGGLAVSESEFQQKSFPMKQGMHKYVWFQGTKSANGKLQLTGLLAPNPLGFHDILGNADEIVLEPFRLNRISRLHGQTGGFIVKGGNYFTSGQDIRSSYRQEIPHFDQKGAKRVKTIGFRLAISAPVVTSPGRLKKIKNAWQEISRSQPKETTKQIEKDVGDPVEELAALESTLKDTEQKTKFQRVALVLRANIAERNEQRDRATKSMLRLGAFLGQKIRDDKKRLSGIQAILNGRKAAGGDGPTIQRLEGSVAAAEATMRENLNYYAEVVLQVVQEYSAEKIDAQYQKLITEFESQDLKNLVPFAESFANCIVEYRKTGQVNAQSCTSTSIHK